MDSAAQRRLNQNAKRRRMASLRKRHVAAGETVNSNMTGASGDESVDSESDGGGGPPGPFRGGGSGGGALRVPPTKNMLQILSADIIEQIGTALDSVSAIQQFNQVMVMRMYHGVGATGRARVPASAVSMTGLPLLKGNLDNTANMSDNVSNDSESGNSGNTMDHHYGDALLFGAMNNICQQQTERLLAHRLIQELVNRYPMALVSQNRRGNTPLHELLKQVEWQNVVHVDDLLVGKDNMMRSAAGVEQRLIQNRNGNTLLHLALKYSLRPDFGCISSLIDTEKTVLSILNGHSETPLQALFLRNSKYMETSHVEKLVLASPEHTETNDALLEYTFDGHSTALFMAIIASLRRFRLREKLSSMIPLLVDSQEHVLRIRYTTTIHCIRDNTTRETSDTPLHMAIKFGMPWDAISLLVGRNGGGLFQHTAADEFGVLQGDLPVHLAIKEKSEKECVSGLIDANAEVLIETNHYGDCPLHTALRLDRYDVRERKYRVEMVELLMTRGLAAHTDFLLTRGHGGDMALHIAVQKPASHYMIEALVVADSRALLAVNGHSEFNTSQLQQDTPLHLAFKMELPTDILELLVDENRAVLSTANHAGKIPLHIAAYKRCFSQHSIEEICLALSGSSRSSKCVVRPGLPDGLDLRLICDGGSAGGSRSASRTDLHYAVQTDARLEIIRLLLDPDGTVVRIRDENGDTPMHIGARRGASFEVMKLMADAQQHITCGNDVRTASDNHGYTPLHFAVQKNADPRIIELLIQGDRSVLSMRNEHGDTPLHTATKRSDKLTPARYHLLWTMMPALRPGQPPTDMRLCQNGDGNTPLHLACHTNTPVEMLKLLIDPSGEVLRVPNAQHRTPAHMHGELTVEIAQLIVTKEVSRVRDIFGCTPLNRVVSASFRCPCIRVLTYLVELDPAVLRIPNENSFFPIHNALSSALPVSREIIQLLLADGSAGPDGNTLGDIRLERDGDKHTPLLVAICHNVGPDILSILVDAQQRVLGECIPKTGETPLHLFLHRESTRPSCCRTIQLLRGRDHGILLVKDSKHKLPLHTALTHSTHRYTHSAETIRLLLPPLFPERGAFIGATEDEVDHLHSVARASALALTTQPVTPPQPPKFTQPPETDSDHSDDIDSGTKSLPSADLFMANGFSAMRFPVRYTQDLATIRLLRAHFGGVVPFTTRSTDLDTDLLYALRKRCCISTIVCLLDPAGAVLFMQEQKTHTLDTPLHMCLRIQCDDLSEDDDIKRKLVLMDSPRMILQQQNSVKQTPLHVALQYKATSLQMLNMLDSLDGPSQYAANVDKALPLQNQQGATALHMALELLQSENHWEHTINEWLDVCRQLVDVSQGVLCIQDQDGATPLHVATRCGLLHTNQKGVAAKVQEWFIDTTQNVLLLQDTAGRTPLHLAIAFGVTREENFGAFVSVIRERCLIDPQEHVLRKQDTTGNTPVHAALKNGLNSPSVLEMLVGGNEDVLVLPDKNGSLPLHVALEKGITSIPILVFLLGNANAQVICRHSNNEGHTPLSIALGSSGDISIIRILLALFPFPEHRQKLLTDVDYEKRTLLHIALQDSASLAKLRLLVDEQKKVLNKQDVYGNTPLHVGLKFGVQCRDVGFLMDRRLSHSPLLLRDSAGHTPLHVALIFTPHDQFESLLSTIEVLIDTARDVLLLTRPDGGTPLHAAISKLPHLLTGGDFGLLRLLMGLRDQGKTVLTVQDWDGNTPLHMALQRIPLDASMLCLSFLSFLVDDLKTVLTLCNLGHRTPLAGFRVRVPTDSMNDPAVEAAIVEILTPPAAA